MKPFAQFFALLRYHATASPWIWFIPFAFGLQPVVLMAAEANGTWRSLMIPLTSLSMMAFGPLMIASFVFAVDKMFMGNSWLTMQTSQQVQTFSGDFLLTRAIDRPVLFGARVAFYWVLISLPLLLLLSVAIWWPSLKFEVPLKNPNLAEYYLSHVPGAELTQTTKNAQVIGSPYGNLALAASMALFGLGAAAVCKTLLFVILPLRFRRGIFWVVLVGCVVGGPFFIRGNSGGSVGPMETAVIWTMGHLALCGLVVVGLAVVSYFFCAERDRRLEYP